MKNAMFTVEVLISIFILFLVVAVSASSSKFLNQILRQQDRYKELYSIVFSIKDEISNKICIQEQTISGEMSNLAYRAKCILVKEKRGLVKDYDFDSGKEVIGYTDTYQYRLYQVELEIEKSGYITNYYINRYSEK